MNVTDLSIMKALKIGKVPNQGTRHICVGRDLELAEFGRVLDFARHGGFETRFLRGDYGSGKTFMCSVVRELAFEKHMIVSIINLSREVPFGKRDLVLSEILRGLRTPSSGNACALDEIVQQWFGKYDPGTPLNENSALENAINAVSTGDAGLAMARRAYSRAYCDGNDALMQGAMDWLRGETIPADVRSQLKVVGKLNAEGAFRRLRGVCALMRDAGYPGLVILIDEVESIMRLAKPQRDAAYTSMRELIDIGSDEFPYCFLLFAGTQLFFEDEFKGVASYQALFQRIRSQQVGSGRDLRQPIIRLEEFDEHALWEVSIRVRDLHGSAYEWDAATTFADHELQAFIKTAGAKFGEIRQKPRAYLKALVDMLDARQQHLDVASDTLIESAAAVERQDAHLDDTFVEAVA
ncbi:MAG: DUF2791 family P-loop domain-containing protein [Vulcanimicrobiaceae bacterium]